MGMFEDMAKKMKESRASAGGNYIPPGRHLVKIEVAKLSQTRKEEDMFVSDLKVITTDCDKPDAQPGRILNYVMMAKNEVYFPNLKAYFLAAMGMAEEDFNNEPPEDAAAALDEAFGTDQILVGRYMVVDAILAESKAKKTYTRVRWSTPSDEEIAAAKALAL